MARFVKMTFSSGLLPFTFLLRPVTVGSGRVGLAYESSILMRVVTMCTYI